MPRGGQACHNEQKTDFFPCGWHPDDKGERRQKQGHKDRQQAHNNRNRDKLQAAGVGARAEFHEWRIGETLRRSWIADVYRLTTP